jgi:hypothetical protein
MTLGPTLVVVFAVVIHHHVVHYILHGLVPLVHDMQCLQMNLHQRIQWLICGRLYGLSTTLK